MGCGSGAADATAAAYAEAASFGFFEEAASFPIGLGSVVAAARAGQVVFDCPVRLAATGLASPRVTM